MDSLQTFTASRLAIVAGKGGVGKTTVTAALARAAADRGLRVLVIDVDGRPGLAALLSGGPAGASADCLVTDQRTEHGAGVKVFNLAR